MKKLVYFHIPVLRTGLLLLLLSLIYSCEKQQFERNNVPELKKEIDAAALQTRTVYFSETFTITSKEALVAQRSLANPDFSNYENFTITVKNGKSGKTKVTKMEIKIDGKVVVTYKDFKRNAAVITKPLSGLTASSGLRVRIEGSKGRFITVTIECTSKTSSVTDVDGNVYKTVKIGDQWWMAENLKVTKLNDNTPISNIMNASDWLSTAADYTPAYCWYDNDEDYKSTYGALYNWVAAGNEKLCPEGWHVPESEDYYELMLYIDPDAAMGYYSAVAGGALKEEGTSHWFSPNTGATDEYGFAALPGGVRNVFGEFAGLSTAGSWWSDAGLSSIHMSYDDASALFSEGGNEYGRSVRCIRNQ